MTAVGPHPLGARVLVVEDDPVNAKVACVMLEHLGCTATEAPDGAAALEAVARESFDVILMDAIMPGMDGHETTRAMRARPELADVPIIAFTASEDWNERDRALAAGMNDFVTKPVDPALLRAVLTKWLPSENGGGGPNGARGGGGRPVLDLADALDRVGGDSMILNELLDLFVGAWPGTRAGLEHAERSEDYAEAARLVHRLKGSASAVGARRIYHLAGRLEERWKAGETLGAPAEMAELFEEMDAVIAEVRAAAEERRSA